MLLGASVKIWARKDQGGLRQPTHGTTSGG